MAKLSTKERKALPDTAFALPNRRYPIHNASHARNALARVSEFGSEREKVLVKAAIHRKYPSMHAFSYKHTPTKQDPSDNQSPQNQALD